MTATKKIRLLSDQIINQIAAGEVIENPASVVKELVENALDAEATAISIEILNGGRQLIRIRDNGSGMSRDDALLSLERHATSKISTIHDIEDVATMGFRGEALPSIASISKFSILTAQPNEEGTFICVEGGKLLSCTPAVRDPGTTIEVKALFFNVPVRRKFQKSPAYDTQEILKMIGILSLARPEIHFELISDEKSIFKTTLTPLPFIDSLEKRVETLLGRENAQGLIPLSLQSGEYKIEGFIGSPQRHKPNRTGQYLFINKRAVFSGFVSSAIREGYSTLLPSNRYPLFALHLTLPGTFVDVNVHPQKREVRIRQEHELKSVLIEAVQKGLREEELGRALPIFHQPREEPPPFWGAYASLLSPGFTPSSLTPGSSRQIVEFHHSPVNSVKEESWFFKSSSEAPLILSENLEKEIKREDEAEENITKPLFTPFPKIRPKVLTTLSGFFLVDPFGLEAKLFGKQAMKEEGGLALIDQRAAYARIQFERLLKNSNEKHIQSLLFPITLQFDPQESFILREHLEVFNKMGFSLREFGDSTYLLDAFPAFMKEESLTDCLTEILGSLLAGEGSRKVEMSKEEQLALAACRSTLPTKKQLSKDEATKLLEDLLQCDIVDQSPLGQLIALYLAPDEVGKLFLRQSKFL